MLEISQTQNVLRCTTDVCVDLFHTKLSLLEIFGKVSLAFLGGGDEAWYTQFARGNFCPQCGLIASLCELLSLPSEGKLSRQSNTMFHLHNWIHIQIYLSGYVREKK